MLLLASFGRSAAIILIIIIVVVFIEEPLPEKKETKRDKELDMAEGSNS